MRVTRLYARKAKVGNILRAFDIINDQIVTQVLCKIHRYYIRKTDKCLKKHLIIVIQI